MTISIESMEGAEQINEFVNAAFEINHNNPLWTPPLKNQEMDLLTPGRHPFWENADRKLFAARENGKVIGRIAAIIDRKYNSYAQENCGAFGFFECKKNFTACHALLETCREWLAGQGMTFMRGPLNPSTNYTCGLLVDGFDQAPPIMMPWNPPYYAELLETWPLFKEQDLFAYTLDKANLKIAPALLNEIERLKAEKIFTCRPSSKKTLEDDIRAMLNIYKEAWERNWGFSPLSASEAERHVHELKSILDPEFFVLFFHNDVPVAGMVALPDMNPLLKRLNGKIGLLAPLHYLKSRKDIRKGYRIMLFGILPEFRLHGLPLLLFDYMLKKAVSRPDFEWVEGSWVLEDNFAIDDLIEDFSGRITRRYRIYRREIGLC